MFGIDWIDWIAIGVYLLLVTGVGLWAGRLVKGMRDFVMPRTFGKTLMIMHSFGTATHSDQAVTVASKCYTNGLSGIWYQLQWLFATPFFWLIAPMMRRFRAITMANVFEARFDRSVAVLFVGIGLMKFTVNVGLMLKGTSTVIDACTGGAVPADQLVFVMTVLFVVYGLVGGLRAAIITDFVQGVLVIVFSFILLSPMLQELGGWSSVQTRVTSATGSQSFFTLVAPGIGVFYVVMYSLNALIGVVVQPQNLGVCGAGRTELEGAVGFMCGTMLKRVCTVAWAMTGLAAVALYGTQVKNPDLIYGMAARDFLPQIMPGLLGIFMAALLATVMGSCDSFMVSASGLVAENLYRPLFPGRSETHYLWVARISGLLVVVTGVVFAYWLEGVVQGLEILWKIGAMMGVAFWLGMFWRRTTVAGAWASTLSAFAIWWLTSQTWCASQLAQLPSAHNWGMIVAKMVDGQQIPHIALPWQMVFYLSGALVVGILVSLATRPVDPGQLEAFYGLLRTPVQLGEQPAGPCRLPEAVVAGPRRVLWPSSNLEIPIPSRRAVVGFVAGWACVLVLLSAVDWLVAL